jgi:hypothetical protein
MLILEANLKNVCQGRFASVVDVLLTAEWGHRADQGECSRWRIRSLFLTFDHPDR